MKFQENSNLYQFKIMILVSIKSSYAISY